MNKSVMKCCICNNENIGEFITINDKKYHLCCIEQLQQENQKLKIQISVKEEVANKYKEVIDKAIKYIGSKEMYNDAFDTEVYKLLKILKEVE